MCLAFVEALRTYGVPEEVLTDNGKVFTGRFTRPMSTEVLFERICRQNGITTRLTRPRSPTTTGKIERLHQSLQNELLDDHGPFETMSDAQAAIDGWRGEYNTTRPHQSLGMAAPAERFQAKATDGLELMVPTQLSDPAATVLDTEEAPEAASAWTSGLQRVWQPPEAVELKREVPPSGNMWIGGQQVWFGPAMAGRVITIWVDQSRMHVLLDGVRLKTLPSRLGPAALARLARSGAVPAGPAPLPELDEGGDSIDVDRTVNAVGTVGLAGRQYSVGVHLAGQRVTLRLQGHTMAVLAGNKLLRTLPCTVPVSDRPRLRGTRPSPKDPIVLTDPVRVERKVDQNGVLHVATQKVRVGKTHAGKVVTVHVRADLLHVEIEPGLVLDFPRTNHQALRQHKAHAPERIPRAYPHRKT